MGGAGEQVYAASAAGGVAHGGQKRQVPCQGCRVAGHIHQPLNTHFINSGEHLRRAALAWRVYDGHIRAHALGRQLRCRTGCVRTQEFCILNAVAPGILPGVLHRLGNHLHVR